jgi:hypothetical protein
VGHLFGRCAREVGHQVVLLSATSSSVGMRLVPDRQRHVPHGDAVAALRAAGVNAQTQVIVWADSTTNLKGRAKETPKRNK